MKKLLTLALVSLSICTAKGQQFSGGFRTGTSCWMDREKLGINKPSEGQEHTWDKSLFVRYQPKGKFAFEAGLTHFSWKGKYRDIQMEYFEQPEYDYFKEKESNQNIQLDLSVQYDLTCKGMQSCPVLKKMKSYVGIIISPTLTRYTTETVYRRTSDASIGSTTGSRDELSIWTGLTHTLVYPLCNNFYITSMAKLQVEPTLFFQNTNPVHYPDSRFSMQIGVGYNF